MSEIERLHQQRLARTKKAQQDERPDPTEWRPEDNHDYERVEANLSAEHMSSAPMNYRSLADLPPETIAGIEASARADLIRAMDRQGLSPIERGLRTHWQLVVEGYGFRMPEGYVHPEAPDEVKAEGVQRWKRVVEIASDSMAKFMFVVVWRRKFALQRPAPHEIEGPDIVDAEVAECDPIDDVQDHHDWDYETHGGSLGVCKRCGVHSQGWEE